MTGERGSALVIAVLVMAIMTLLGMSLLLMADTENRIAENERLSAQALYFGEGIAREVKRWFDRPPYSVAGGSNLVRPTTAVMVRTDRVIDDDGPGPAGESHANGTVALPYYKVGVDNDGDGQDDIFDRPYRPGLKDMFVGTAAGPDVKIERAHSTTTAAFLDDLSELIMPGFPAGAVGVHARIKEIDVYAPPYLDAGGGTWTRYGVATVAVHVQILRNPGANEDVLAERTVTAVLNETPYGGVFGPLHSCDELAWNNAFKVHWGTATASTTADMPGMSLSIPRDLPPTPRLDLLHGHLDLATSNTLSTNLQGTTIDDPWFRFFAGSSVQNWSAFGSPQVHPPGPTPIGQDESNKFQDFPSVSCPEFDYQTWKSIAQSGFSDVHYFAWAGGTSFRENGSGTSAPFIDLTNGKTGLFFFDTTDGKPPHDFDAGNVASNLTDEIVISGGYGTRGFLYVNTKKWSAVGSPGRPGATFTLPGEPFFDQNENGVYDSGEAWVNLRYIGFANIDAPLVVDESDTFGAAAPLRNPVGPSVLHDAIVWGILYLSGQFDASGTPYYDGSVVTFAGTETGVKTAGTASLFWDPTIKQNWPPVDWNMPRVIITRWETDE